MDSFWLFPIFKEDYLQSKERKMWDWMFPLFWPNRPPLTHLGLILQYNIWLICALPNSSVWELLSLKIEMFSLKMTFCIELFWGRPYLTSFSQAYKQYSFHQLPPSPSKPTPIKNYSQEKTERIIIFPFQIRVRWIWFLLTPPCSPKVHLYAHDNDDGPFFICVTLTLMSNEPLVN